MNFCVLPRLWALAGLVAIWATGFGCEFAAENPSQSPSPPAQSPPRARIEPGALLIEWMPGQAPLLSSPAPSLTGSSSARQAIDLAGRLVSLERLIVPEEDVRGGAIVLARLLDTNLTTEDTFAALLQVARDPRVRRAEPDRIRSITGMPPNDALYAAQWAHAAIHVAGAWEISTGSPDVVVAILDTGILPHHPDLVGRLLPGFDFISRAESADDDSPGRDADATDTGTIETSRLHGTHVAGIIGAQVNNARGIAGIDQQAMLLPIRVLGVRGGDGTDSDISDAVRWAAGLPVAGVPTQPKRADVINLSFAGPAKSFTLERVIGQAIDAGSLVIAAAGNAGSPVEKYAPGALDGVITVGASDRIGQRASYSNFGSRVDVIAPGDEFSFDPEAGVSGIYSTFRDTGTLDAEAPYAYDVLIGTSQAAPHVAAAASLVRAVFPAVSQEALRALLWASAKRPPVCSSDGNGGCGGGLLDLPALLALATAQAACRCPTGQLCLEGGLCRLPPQRHPPRIPDNQLSARYCMLGTLGPTASSDTWPLPSALLLSLWWLRRRGRRLRPGPFVCGGEKPCPLQRL